MLIGKLILTFQRSSPHLSSRSMQSKKPL